MSETPPDYIHDSRPADLHPALELYDIRDAVVRCEDNLKFMRDLQGDSMKLIVTSPPYNLGKAYERRHSFEAYLSAQAQVISECVRLLHPDGSRCWQVRADFASVRAPSVRRSGSPECQIP